MNDQMLSCGHPIQAASKMLPDFFGDTPATQKIGTAYCRWCADVARAEARVKKLEKWHAAVLSIVDGLDDPHVGLTWFENAQEVCAAELEHLRSVLVPLVRGEGL